MGLPLFIAHRYLFAGKSHNVINIISAISAVGMAVGTAALIIILSIYNGFDAIVKSMLSEVEPDLVVRPSEGKFFVPEGKAYDFAYDSPLVKNMCSVLKEQVFAAHNGHQATVTLMGVDEVFQEESAIRNHLIGGSFEFGDSGKAGAALGASLARRLGVAHFLNDSLTLYYPDRTARVSAINPMGAVRTAAVWPSCEFSVNAQIDNNLVIVSRELMCGLLGRSDEVSQVEIRFADNCTKKQAKSFRKQFQDELGPSFRVYDRVEQNPSMYKMLAWEKFAVCLIMIFVILILGFSIFGSLSMLIIDKREDISTLRAMGADRKLIRRVFTLEGWMITLYGMAAGLVIGIVFCLLQQHFGLIKMPGNYIMQAYPVILNWIDVLVAGTGIALLGYLIALVPVRRIRL